MDSSTTLSESLLRSSGTSFQWPSETLTEPNTGNGRGISTKRLVGKSWREMTPVKTMLLILLNDNELPILLAYLRLNQVEVYPARQVFARGIFNIPIIRWRRERDIKYPPSAS